MWFTKKISRPLETSYENGLELQVKDEIAPFHLVHLAQRPSELNETEP